MNGQMKLKKILKLKITFPNGLNKFLFSVESDVSFGARSAEWYIDHTKGITGSVQRP